MTNVSCKPGEGGWGDRPRRRHPWAVETARGSAAELHGRGLPDPVRRTVSLLEVDRPALVLGSTQPDGEVDREAAERAGVEVVRRRSGGGAVLLVPRGVVWADVSVPAGDPLWDADVGRAFAWLGRAWREVVVALGAPRAEVEVHEGALVRTPLSRSVCFAGLGPGEVTWRGRKVVGMSQRRTRAGALFQCAILRTWDPAPLADLLRLDPAALEPVATGVDAATGEAVAAALLRALPD